MATTTPNFGWAVPTSTDLVKDGAVAIETLGDAIDASLVDLKGGTTGQVLKKNTNTDMDFIWSSDSAGMTNPMTTTGDTIYSSSGSTPARLGIGTTGQVLTVSGGLPSWATPAGGGGKVLQVVSATTTTAVSLSTTTPTDTTLTATITPSSSSSKILVLLSQHFFWNRNGTEATVKYIVLRDATQIYDLDSSSMFSNYVASATQIQGRNNIAISYLDSPNTTSATTYKTQAWIATTSTANFNNGATSSIVLMEIGA